MKICVVYTFEYPAASVFDIFADVRAYSDYVPRIALVTIVNSRETPLAIRLKIRAKIQNKNFQFPVTAVVTLIKACGDIHVSYKIGPVRLAEAVIHVHAANDTSCRVSCDIVVHHIPPALRALVQEKRDALVQEYTRVFVDRVTQKLQ